jgi:hypothetical protein
MTGCIPYNCSGGTCLTSCTNNGDCAGPPTDRPYCDASGHCVPLLVPGQPCTSDDQCHGGCADGSGVPTPVGCDLRHSGVGAARPSCLGHGGRHPHVLDVHHG